MLSSRLLAPSRVVAAQRPARRVCAPRAEFDMNETTRTAQGFATLAVSGAASLGAVGAAAYPIFDTFFSVQGLKRDVQGLKEDVQGVKKDVQGVKEDVLCIKKDMKKVKRELKRVDSVVVQIAQKMGIVVPPLAVSTDDEDAQSCG